MTNNKKGVDMKIVVAKRSGFCFGVKRAVDMAFDMATKKKGVCTLGPIIHNPQVVDSLRNKGVVSVEEPSKEMTSIIIRTHGIPVTMYEKIDNMGIEAVDATCPFVKNAQTYAKLLKDEGYQVVILGDRNHPEVKSIMSFSGDDVIVAAEGGTPSKLKPKVGVVVQTTQPVEALKNLLSHIVGKAREIKIHDTICNSTALRLKETSEICEKVDIMIVVGGKNSANTTQLANLCESKGARTYHVETATELSHQWIKGIQSVGITAGASTPRWIIEEVVDKIKYMEGEVNHGNSK